MVEGARLERVYTGNRIEGSNPSPSAKSVRKLPARLVLAGKFLLISEGFAAAGLTS